MTDTDLENFITRIATESGEAGAKSAFLKLGLADEMASADIKAIRGMISAVRIVRVKTVSTALSGLSKMIGWGFLLLFIYVTSHYFPVLGKRFIPETAEILKP